MCWNYPGHDSADFRLFTSDRTVLIAGALGNTAGWTEKTLSVSVGAPKDLDLSQQVDYGTGVVTGSPASSFSTAAELTR